MVGDLFQQPWGNMELLRGEIIGTQKAIEGHSSCLLFFYLTKISQTAVNLTVTKKPLQEKTKLRRGSGAGIQRLLKEQFICVVKCLTG